MAVNSKITDLALISTFAAFIAVCSIIPGIPVGGISITLQTFAVGLTGLLLGARRGFFAVFLWELAGFANLPVFSQGGSGIGVLSRPSGGYLIGFLAAVVIIGAIASYALQKTFEPKKMILIFFAAAGIAGLVIEHIFGIAGMCYNLGMTLKAAILLDLVFVPLDLVKGLLAAVVAVSCHQAFPKLR